MSNWIFTQKGAVLKSEILVIFPQYVEVTQRFQVVAALRNNTTVVLFENLASYDLAMMIIDKILSELDATHQSLMTQSKEENQVKTSTPETTPELKKPNGKQTKKVKNNEDVE